MNRMCKICNEKEVDKYSDICESCYEKNESKERIEFFIILFGSMTFISLFVATVYTFRDVIKHILLVSSNHFHQFFDSLPVFFQIFLGVFLMLSMIILFLWGMYKSLMERFY